MKTMTRQRVIIVTAIVLMVAFTATISFAEALRGRDYVRSGTMKTMEGTLVQDGHEWGLLSGDMIYDLHMGPEHYRTDKGLILNDGATAVVAGFVDGSDIAVTAIETGGASLTLRDDMGRPAWAGTSYGGGRMQAQAKRDCSSCDAHEKPGASCDCGRDESECQKMMR